MILTFLFVICDLINSLVTPSIGNSRAGYIGNNITSSAISRLPANSGGEIAGTGK